MATSSSGGDKVTRNLVIGMVALVVVVGASFSYFGSKGSTTAAIPSSVSKTDGYGIVFNADVPNIPTIDVYEDFQCPVCARFEAINGITLEKAIEEKKAKVVYHTLSFLGTESVLAANAAACAADEDKFLAFHKAFYTNQPAENAGAINATFLKALGASIGITSDKFATCVDNGGYSDWVKNVAEAGSKANVNSTPTVFVNGKEIDRNTEYFNVEAFAKAIAG
jgi:protein-disulfide isomerase